MLTWKGCCHALLFSNISNVRVLLYMRVKSWIIYIIGWIWVNFFELISYCDCYKLMKQFSLILEHSQACCSTFKLIHVIVVSQDRRGSHILGIQKSSTRSKVFQPITTQSLTLWLVEIPWIYLERLMCILWIIVMMLIETSLSGSVHSPVHWTGL